METKAILSLGVTVLVAGLLGFFVYQQGQRTPFLASEDHTAAPVIFQTRGLPSEEEPAPSVQSPPIPVLPLAVGGIAVLAALTTLYLVLRKKPVEGEITPYSKVIGATQALVGLQWLLTGITKLGSADFASRFTIDLAETIHETRAPTEWYHNFVDLQLVPRGDWLATAVVTLEIAIGLILLFGAIDWLLGHRIVRVWLHATMSIAVLIVLMVGVFLDYNISLVHGVELPGLTSSDVFAKAIPADFFLIFLSLILVWADVIDLRRTSPKIDTASIEPARQGLGTSPS